MKAVVVLRGTNRKQFTRTVRDEKGEPVQLLKFLNGEPVLVDDNILLAIEKDLGTALFACVETKNGKQKADLEATKALLKDIQRMKRRPRKHDVKKEAPKKDEPQ